MGISLEKGQRLSLTKDNGTGLGNVTVGLGWDPVNKVWGPPAKKGLLNRLFAKASAGDAAADVDLDASILLYSSTKHFMELVYYNKLNSSDGSVKHTGDNLTGDGDGDDEQIRIDLRRVDPSVHHLAVVITSYSGQTFDELENVFCRLVDNDASNSEVLRYDLKESGNNTAQVMAVISRQADGWAFKALGVPSKAKTPTQLADTVASLI